MATNKEIIRELEKELRRLRINNLKLKMHMQVLINHPFGYASAKVRSVYNCKTEAENMMIVPLN